MQAKLLGEEDIDGHVLSEDEFLKGMGEKRERNECSDLLLIPHARKEDSKRERGVGRVFYLSIGRNDGEDGDELERSIRLFITPYLQTIT